MSKKKPPTTIEECNAEMELTQKKIRQYENRNKMLDRKLAIEKRKERNHRLCSRGGYLESLVPALIDMSEQEARDFLYTAVFSDKAQEFLRKRAGEATPKNYPCTQGHTRAHLFTLTGVCALPRALSPHRALLPCAEIGGLRRDRETYTFPATACAVYPFVYPTKANTLLCKLFTFMGFC